MAPPLYKTQWVSPRRLRPILELFSPKFPSNHLQFHWFIWLYLVSVLLSSSWRCTCGFFVVITFLSFLVSGQIDVPNCWGLSSSFDLVFFLHINFYQEISENILRRFIIWLSEFELMWFFLMIKCNVLTLSPVLLWRTLSFHCIFPLFFCIFCIFCYMYTCAYSCFADLSSFIS
jgi:hypothetical protein